MLKTAEKFNLVTVSAAGTAADTVRDLFLEYGESLGFNTCFGGLEQELAALPGDYGPPRGCLLLAKEGGDAAGCVGVRPLDESRCEMKRLFVRPRYRRAGMGRELAETAIARARDRLPPHVSRNSAYHARSARALLLLRLYGLRAVLRQPLRRQRLLRAQAGRRDQ